MLILHKNKTLSNLITMKQNLLFILAAVSAASAYGGGSIHPSALSLYDMVIPADRSLVFDIYAQGKSLPILWGFDTAWNDYGNMVRGVRYAAGANVGSWILFKF